MNQSNIGGAPLLPARSVHRAVVGGGGGQTTAMETSLEAAVDCDDGRPAIASEYFAYLRSV